MGLNVALDTPVFIYFLEKHAHYFEYSRHILEKVIKHEWNAHASVLVLEECLVHPFRVSNMQAVADYTRFICQFPSLHLWNITPEIMTKTAQLRGTIPGLKTPDAIHMATACLAKADFLITNDARLIKMQAIPVISMQDALQL